MANMSPRAFKTLFAVVDEPETKSLVDAMSPTDHIACLEAIERFHAMAGLPPIEGELPAIVRRNLSKMRKRVDKRMARQSDHDEIKRLTEENERITKALDAKFRAKRKS